MNDDAFFTVVFFYALTNGFGVGDEKIYSLCGEMVPGSEDALHDGKYCFHELRRFEFIDVARCIAPEIACWGMAVADMQCVGIGDDAFPKSTDTRNDDIVFIEFVLFCGDGHEGEEPTHETERSWNALKERRTNVFVSEHGIHGFFVVEEGVGWCFWPETL